MANNIGNTSYTTFNAQQNKQARTQLEYNVFNSLVAQAHTKTVDNPKGKLLKNQNPITSFATGVKDTAVDTVNLAKAVTTGKSNDHSLGRINDLGLKIGGIGIAAFLATQRLTKTSKAMEFLGFGAFLASMTLWPKLFIDTPTKMRYGFDPRQKYVDSQGRKKEFFLDNQYLPWDLWEKEDINKVADKMGVDKNMQDREEFTKKKMQKIALQNNTLWMLTAGLGTPLMTSMACKAFENSLNTYNIKSAYKKAMKSLEGINNIQPSGKSSIEDLNKFLKGLNITPETTRAEALNLIADAINPARFVNDFQNPDNARILADNISLQNYVMEDVENALAIKQISPDKVDSFAQILKDNIFEDYTVSSGFSARSRKVETVSVSVEQIKKLINSANSIAETSKMRFSDAFVEAMAQAGIPTPTSHSAETFAGAIEGIFDKSAFKTYETETTLKTFAEQLDILSAIKKKLNVTYSALNSTVGESAESLSTLQYNATGKTLFDRLGIKKLDDLKTIKKGLKEEGAFEAISKFIQSKATLPDAEYEEFIRSFMDAQAKEGPYSSLIDASLAKVKGAVEVDVKQTAEMLDSEIFKHYRTFFDSEGAVEGITHTLQNYMDISRANLRTTTDRILLTLDFERRASDVEYVKTFLKNNLSLWQGSEISNEFVVTDEDVAQFIQEARRVIYNNTMGDFSNNSHQEFEKYGKTIINFIFGEGFSENTRNALSNDSLEALTISKGKMVNNGWNFSKMRQNKEMFTQMGKPLTQLVQETSNMVYNNKTWMRIFGTASIALVGVTLISQLFFGKMKDEKFYEENKGAGYVA